MRIDLSYDIFDLTGLIFTPSYPKMLNINPKIIDNSLIYVYL